jgi:hypothetical protein
MREGIRIHTRWYQPEAEFSFDTAGQTGIYQMRRFRKLGEEMISEISQRVNMPGHAVPADELFRDPGIRGLHLSAWRGHEVPTFHLRNGDDDLLIVLLSSAVKRARVTTPVFHRIGRAKENLYPGEVMCLADPTLELDDELGLSWYMGVPEGDLQEDLADFIVEFARSRSIAPDRIVLWGSSSGGFAALALAARIGTAIAVAVNPQTIAMEYELQTDLVRALCLGGLDDTAIRKRFAARAHMPDAWSGRTDLRAIVVQNAMDTHHYERHFKPFWAALGGTVQPGWSSAGRSLACVYEHPDGHVGETYEMTSEIIDRIRHMV